MFSFNYAAGATFVARGFATPRQPKTVIVEAPGPVAKPTVNVLCVQRAIERGCGLVEDEPDRQL